MSGRKPSITLNATSLLIGAFDGARRYEDMTPLEKAKADMDYYRHKGGIAYKQAKRHYERLLRKERSCRNTAR